MHADGIWLNGLSGRAIGWVFTVLNPLAAGFLEKVYENALVHVLRKAGLAVMQERGLNVTYTEVVVGRICRRDGQAVAAGLVDDRECLG